MNYEFAIQVVGIIGAIFGGINFILIGLAKVFWKLTFVKQEEELARLKEDYATEKEKNHTFRHKHINDISGLETIFNLRIENIKESITEMRKILERISLKFEDKK